MSSSSSVKTGLMERRQLGTTNLAVSRIGLGCVTFGREISEDDSFRILDYAFENGIQLFDTAESYGEIKDPSAHASGGMRGSMHASEKVLGRWLRSRGCRNEVVLQSKISSRLTKVAVREALEATLDRLGVNCLDTYLFHNFDDSVGFDDSFGEMSNAVNASLTRHYGCSNFSLDQLSQSLANCKRLGAIPPATIEPIYNLVHRAFEDDLFPFCHQHGIGITTFSPLGAGFLTGKYSQNATDDPPNSRFHVKPGHRRLYCTSRGFRVLSSLREIAARTEFTLAHLAIGWALRNPLVSSVLIGATRIDHVRNALAALETPLPDPIIVALNATGT